jgi:hypothetical protein
MAIANARVRRSSGLVDVNRAARPYPKTSQLAPLGRPEIGAGVSDEEPRPDDIAPFFGRAVRQRPPVGVLARAVIGTQDFLLVDHGALPEPC